MYPTLVIRPGESIKVRVNEDIFLCGSGGMRALAGVSWWQHRRVTPLSSRLLFGYGRTVTFVIFSGVTGRLIAPSSPSVVGTPARASTTFRPDVTLAKMT